MSVSSEEFGSFLARRRERKTGRMRGRRRGVYKRRKMKRDVREKKKKKKKKRRNQISHEPKLLHTTNDSKGITTTDNNTITRGNTKKKPQNRGRNHTYNTRIIHPKKRKRKKEREIVSGYCANLTSCLYKDVKGDKKKKLKERRGSDLCSRLDGSAKRMWDSKTIVTYTKKI